MSRSSEEDKKEWTRGARHTKIFVLNQNFSFVTESTFNAEFIFSST
jgi:hypothetical protein